MREAETRGERRDPEDQQRPDEVELLLDRERPVVLDRTDRRRLEGEVVEVLGDEVPVGEVERRGDHVVGDVLSPLGREHDRGDDGDHSEDRCGEGEQASCAPGVEVAQR